MLVELSQVTKKLGSFSLEQISFGLPGGFICGLIGPNGAGKTTLIHLLLGLYRPDGGELKIEGMDYEEQERAIHEIVGAVLQEDLFEDTLTLRQNGNEYGKYFKEYSAELLESYLERFGLQGNRRFKELSKGEKLKFQFAFALSHRPKLLILDEPTGNFDPSFREEFFAVLKEFIADGERSVILSTHLTDDLDKMADYILYLDKGTPIFVGDIETLHDNYRLITGEDYKIKLLRPEAVLHVEKGQWGSRALIRHRQRYEYDKSLTVTVPTIEELMYFMTKRRGK